MMTNHPPPLEEAEAYYKMMQPEAIRIRNVIALKYFNSIHHEGVLLKITTLQ